MWQGNARCGRAGQGRPGRVGHGKSGQGRAHVVERSNFVTLIWACNECIHLTHLVRACSEEVDEVDGRKACLDDLRQGTGWVEGRRRMRECDGPGSH